MGYGCRDARGASGVGAGLATPFGRQRCWPWVPGPSPASRVVAIRPFLWHKDLRGSSTRQDMQLIPAHLEVLSARLSPAGTTIVGKWSSLTAPGCKESLVLVYRP